MKKVIWIGVIVGVLLIGLGVVGMAYAQTQNPPQPQTPAAGAYDQNYPGMMGRGGRGMMGGRFAQGQADSARCTSIWLQRWLKNSA